GQAAHAGMAPEEGRSAIAAAARAIADMRLGRIDEETSANVGTIEGGVARNIVPDRCRLQAEARSHDEAKLADTVQELLDACSFAASLTGCEVETNVERGFRGYRFRRDDEPVRLARAALERTGHEPSFALSGGGADANIFNMRGLAPPLTGPGGLGDEVGVNPQAGQLGLGTGGFDVLYANLTRGLGLAPARGAQVIKVPYTRLQFGGRHAGEDGEPEGLLDGMP